MSLKAFHLVFITASSALAFGFGIWELKTGRAAGGQTADLLFGLGSLATGLGLILYEWYFLRKTRNISFL
jgi:hypothetical protein